MVLIPKKPGAVDVDAFRPICLQNCSLKILSKVLTRLQKDIPNLIDIRQTGYIRGDPFQIPLFMLLSWYRCATREKSGLWC
jgi:hypothetical protein